MRSLFAGLRQLVLPYGAQGGTSRIVLGPDVPALISTITVDGNVWTIYAAELFYLKYPGIYYYNAIGALTPQIAPNDQFARIEGFASNGTVKVVEYQSFMDGFISNTVVTGPDTFTDHTWSMRVRGLFTSDDISIIKGNQPGGKVTNQYGHFEGSGAAGGTTSSATYADAPGSSNFTFIKSYDATDVEIHLDFACWTAGAGATVYAGVNITGGPTSIGDLDVIKKNIDTLSAHDSMSRTILNTAVWAAGTYTARVRWKRNAGTGGLQCDTNDFYSCDINEVQG